jgi:hypothetical protein
MYARMQAGHELVEHNKAIRDRHPGAIGPEPIAGTGHFVSRGRKFGDLVLGYREGWPEVWNFGMSVFRQPKLPDQAKKLSPLRSKAAEGKHA